MNALHFGAMFFCFISLLCLLAALNSDYWIEDSDIHLGLWNACKGIECVIIDVEPIPASLHATRTFMFLGMIAGAASLVRLCTLNKTCSVGNTTISMGWITYIGSFMAGFCVMIAMSIFSGTFGSTNQYGWSFGLGWASFPLYLLTGSLLYRLHKNTATSA
ncbi:lens fiber membrane intrinsic protein-like [Crotalus tigris]|uniref:lens fiber membrane intrinsic protein-like n=1 Tax=Crotalus tigris TaxID=88082 RepID=UPI00192F9E3A|nr:lens fiber membrane intrinsic protein-like [Crotalus tigris]